MLLKATTRSAASTRRTAGPAPTPAKEPFALSFTSRAWYRPNPPLPKVKWSLRNNVNLQQSALLLGMDYVATNRREFLENFYAKGRRSVEKPSKEGPAAWVIPADDPRPSLCAGLVSLLQTHGIEIHRLSAGAEIGDKEKKTKFPAASYVIRMDQPYSRLADMLLDAQFYNSHDTPPYDDTGWSLGPLRNIRTIRVTDAAILKAPMSPVTAQVGVPGGVTGSGKVLAVDHTAEPNLATFRFRLREMKILAAEEPFDAAGHKFAAGTFLIDDSTARDRVSEAAQQLGVKVYALPQMPKVATHPLAAPRVALVHTWTDTQNEGWFRYAFDQLGFRSITSPARSCGRFQTCATGGMSFFWGQRRTVHETS